MAARLSSAKVRHLLVTGAAAAMLSLAACGGDDDEDGGAASGDSSEQAEGGVIKMHANFEYSGPGALYGVSKAVGVKAAAEMVNEEGGITVQGKNYTIEVVECDNRTEATYGVQCAQQAVDEEVLWTAAPDLGFEGAYEIYKENDILTIGNGGAASTLLNEQLDQNPLLTFEFLTYQQNVESHLKQLRALYPDAKRVATLLPNDANGQVQDEAFRTYAPDYGFEIVAQELHPTDASGDFSSYLTNLKAGNPDVIHLGYYPTVAAAALEQGAQLDAAEIFTAEGLTFNDLEGVSFDGYPLIGFQTGWNYFEGFMPEDAEEQELVARFEELAGDDPVLPSIIVLGFIGDVMMIKEAIEKADSLEPQEIVAAYEGVRYEGPFGPADGLENRATDVARTPFVVDEEGNVKAYVFPTGLADEPEEEIEVAESPLG